MPDLPPNILLICTDHWPGPLSRPAGHPTVMTPTLEGLARNGVTYTNCYSTCPVCVPARRTLMTGLSGRSHGAIANGGPPLPARPLLAQCFRDAGYQAFAVGKLHTNPQRSRIGFDEVILNEEGRLLDMKGLKRLDDWERFVADRGYPGMAFSSGLSSNDYLTRGWPLPEDCHPTNWAVGQMCRTITRRDPSKPAFWYLSIIGPHPPVWPPQDYLDLYRDVPLEEIPIGDWAKDFESLPPTLRNKIKMPTISNAPAHEVALARRAFYASMTHIDHQIRLVLGTLREEGLLDRTAVAFTSDHGDMLGHHGLWAKSLYYEMSARVPLFVMLPAGDTRLPTGTCDNRLAELRDLLPTLLDVAGIDIPEGTEGESFLQPPCRGELYGEFSDNPTLACRMLRMGTVKLIYYPLGNHLQLFDIQTDPLECVDLSADPAYKGDLDQLTARMIELFTDGERAAWVRDGMLAGQPDQADALRASRNFGNQRGLHF